MNQKQLISFMAVRVLSKPTRVIFHAKNGEEVTFISKKNIPQVVRVNFLASKKRK